MKKIQLETVRLVKDFAYSIHGYDYNLGHAGDEVELTPDLVRMARETGAVKAESEEKPAKTVAKKGRK